MTPDRTASGAGRAGTRLAAPQLREANMKSPMPDPNKEGVELRELLSRIDLWLVNRSQNVSPGSLLSELREAVEPLLSTIKALEAERDEALERVEELERDAEIVSTEFEKDCWIAVRALLEKVGVDDFSEGVTAQAACDIIWEAIQDGERRSDRAEALNRELVGGLEPFAALADAYERHRDQTAEQYVDSHRLAGCDYGMARSARLLIQKARQSREGVSQSQPVPGSVRSAPLPAREAVPSGRGDYRPVAIHYAEADALEFVQRDVPTVAEPATPNLDRLLDLKTREPIGWRIYGWSRIAPPPAEHGASGRPGHTAADRSVRDEPLPPPPLPHTAEQSGKERQ